MRRGRVESSDRARLAVQHIHQVGAIEIPRLNRKDAG